MDAEHRISVCRRGRHESVGVGEISRAEREKKEQETGDNHQMQINSQLRMRVLLIGRRGARRNIRGGVRIGRRLAEVSANAFGFLVRTADGRVKFTGRANGLMGVIQRLIRRAFQ